jgi:hypothetical protein
MKFDIWITFQQHFDIMPAAILQQLKSNYGCLSTIEFRTSNGIQCISNFNKNPKFLVQPKQFRQISPNNPIFLVEKNQIIVVSHHTI